MGRLLLSYLGFPRGIDLLGDPTSAWIILLILDMWQWTPFIALILMAGLQSLPGEPREAALVDGATPWQMFRHITLPAMVPFIAIAAVLRTIQAFKTFDAFKILTGGGPPGESTEIINLGIFRVGLQSFNVGLACALGVIFLIILSLLVPIMLRVIGRQSDPGNVMTTTSPSVRRGLIARMIIGRTFLWAWLIVGLVPLLFMFVTSIKPAGLANQIPPAWLFTPTLENYASVLSAGGGKSESFGQLLLNSAIVSLGAACWPSQSGFLLPTP